MRGDPPGHSLRSILLYAPLLLMATLIATCASDDPHLRDARTCRARATRREVKELPNDQPIVVPTGYNEKLYQQCMKEHGWTDDLEKPAP